MNLGLLNRRNSCFVDQLLTIFPIIYFTEQNKKTPISHGYRSFYGATDPIRTDDLLITSELLCQLSHSSKREKVFSSLLDVL